MFIEDVNEILESRGVTTVTSIWNYVEAWKQFVQLCEDGYSFDISEYDNDIYCRQVLQYIINEVKLVVYPEYWDLGDRVKQFDNRFLVLIYPNQQRNDKDSWWERGILKKAYSEYARDIKNLYDIHVEVLT